MSTEDIAEIEESIRRHRIHIEIGNALERLSHNADFKQIVLEGYFREEAIRLVHLKGHPAMQGDEQQKSIVQQMDAISCFSQYLDLLKRNAALAVKHIANDEQTRDELMEEDLSNG